MSLSPWRRTGLVALLLFGLGVVLLALLAVALKHGAPHGGVVRFLAWRMGRSLVVRGPLQLELLSLHPTLQADDVTLGNPVWARPGIMGTARHVALTFRWGRGLEALQLEGADLQLLRDTEGFANWQFKRPVPGSVPRLPSLTSLRASAVHLHLSDAQRHLEFDGAVSGGSTAGAPLRLTAQGILNSRPAQASLAGDALGAPPAQPYRFELNVSGSAAHVSLKASLPKPFELDLQEGAFEAGGADLKDLYYLTGLRLINTGAFRLAGRLERHGTLTRLAGLSLSAGESDLQGTLSIDTAGQRSRLDGELHSRRLRIQDMGLRAAGREPNPDPPLFSDAPLSFSGVRHVDARIAYAADRLQWGRFEFAGLTGRLEQAQGVLDLPHIDSQLLGGRFSGQLHLDARPETPTVALRVQLQGGELQQLPFSSDSPPIAGPLQISARLAGRGRSLHELAATADGSAEFHIGAGEIRASIVELTGLDLRGIGLTLTKSQREIGLRCAAGRFQVDAGTMSASQLLVDTDTVVIRGLGSIRLGDESLDLQLQGEPRQTRLLRLTAPLLIKGPLRKPAISAQTQGASFKLIDRGHAAQIDCSAL